MLFAAWDGENWNLQPEGTVRFGGWATFSDFDRSNFRLSLWRDNTGSRHAPAWIEHTLASQTIAGEPLWGTSEIWRHVKPTPLFPERVFEAPRHSHRVPSEPVGVNAKVHERSTRATQWQADAGRQAGDSCGNTGAPPTPFSDGGGWDGQTDVCRADRIGDRHIQATITMVNVARADSHQRMRPGGAHWSTRGEGRTLKRNKAQGSIEPKTVATLWRETDLEVE